LTLSVITPVYNEDPVVFKAALDSWKDNKVDEIIAVMNVRPSLKDRATSSERVLGKVKDFVETFIDGMG
jgi:hypothetical protein